MAGFLNLSITASMQSLAKTYLKSFEQLIRQKGRQLFQAGRTQISKSEPGLLCGSCEDSGDRHKINARVQGHELHVHCECAYFQSGKKFCRHIWAFMLSIDQRGFSSFLSVDPIGEDSKGVLVADQIWLEQVKSVVEKEEGSSWKSLINNVERIRKTQEKMLFKPKLEYCLDLSRDSGGKTEICLRVAIRAAELTTDEGNPFSNVPLERLLYVLKPQDLHVINLILGNSASDPLGEERRFKLPIVVEPKLIELLEKVPCTVSYQGVPQGPLETESNQHWEIVLRIEDRGAFSELRPLLIRDKNEIELSNVGFFVMAYPRGFYCGPKRYPLKDNVDDVWLQALDGGESRYTIPVSGIREFLSHFSKACSGLHPRVEWPENFWTETEVEGAPQPIMQVDFNELGLTAELMFEYQLEPPQRIAAFSAQNQVLQWSTRNSCKRMLDEEKKFLDILSKMKDLNFIEEDHHYSIEMENVQDVLRLLEKENVVLFGKERRIKTYSKVQLELSSKVDWFEVKGSVEFGGEKVAIGEMLEAIRSNSRYVLLSNGEYGLLPEQWIAKNKHLFEMAEGKDGNLEVQKNQFLLLKQLTEGNDQSVAVKANKGLKDLNALTKMTEDFEGLEEATPPKELNADLRNYQSSGLSWLRFLKKFHFGGILADDMGLGKTVQAIASLLEEVHYNKKNKLKNLVVMPTSLIFNWTEELRRFAPSIKIYPFTGTDRGDLSKIKEDVILTTYGILRRQAEDFAALQWNYVILDEAQAIKNYKSQTASAVCSLQGEYRLSLTGTPIENNLMEMWSHMQFLNPNLLGSREQFNQHVLKSEEGKADKGLQRLQKMVFPFILRRTKEDVLSDLPPKVEQVIQCSMGSRQQEYYNSIRDEYRKALLDNVTTKGVGGSKLKVIEGLLRLRQVACHPNLIDRNLSIPSTKLNHLINSLLEAISEKHKILVFSQFTSMLELIVRELTREQIRFTYLDGQTKDRQERVHLFQNDPDISVFLISLKAGGTGLNLTAADYVFLFDPWWNPAAEQQAIDRAHRIGQTKKVFTYRLITKDTVEEKVVELQNKKRDMVKGVMSADEGEFVKKLDKSDIEYLFS
jgi:SNF2 family DNA or RNA helicase